MIKALTRYITKNYTKVPLIIVTFNYRYYQKHGKKGSCNATCNPLFAQDEKLKKMFEEMIDYIRDNYDVEKFIPGGNQ